MNLLFYLPIADIARKVNELYGELLFDGVLEEVGAKVRITRKEPVHLLVEEGVLKAVLPVLVYAKITWKERLLGIWDVYTPTFEETDFEITVQYHIQLESDSTWDLKSRTTGSFLWDRRPRIDLGPVKMGVTTLLKPLIMGEIIKVAKDIDRFVAEEVALRKRVREGWEFMQQPQKVSEDPPLWLHIQPGLSSLYTTGVKALAGRLYARVSMPLSLRAVLGDAPEVSAPKAMPPFSHINISDSPLDTVVISQLPYRAFSQLLTGETLSLGNFQLLIRGLGMKFRDGKLNISLSLGVTTRLGPIPRRFRVVLFATCLPYLDEDSRKIRIRDLDYAFLTADLALRFVNRFYRPWFIRKLTQLAHSYLEQLDQDVIAQIREGLSSQEAGEHLLLEGVVSGFRHESLQMTSRHLEVHTRLQGALAFRVVNI